VFGHLAAQKAGELPERAFKLVLPGKLARGPELTGWSEKPLLETRGRRAQEIFESWGKRGRRGSGSGRS
jgi:hypothetical protein